MMKRINILLILSLLGHLWAKGQSPGGVPGCEAWFVTSPCGTGGKRDRREREFLGFAEVVSTDLDTRNGNAAYRSVTEAFDVSSYYRRGLPLTATLRDAAGNKFTETQNNYYTYSVHPKPSSTVVDSLKTISPSDAWPVAYTPVKFTENRSYEGGTAAAKEQSAYRYNTIGCGEVNNYYYSGKGTMNSSTFAGYDYYANASYSSASADGNRRRTISRPTQVVVRNNGGTVLSRTTATYQTGRNAAKVASVTRTVSESPAVAVTTTYNYNASNGNLISVSTQDPVSGTRTYTYQYSDDFLQTYPYQIVAPHDLRTETDSMYLCYGLPKKQTDPNNKALRTIYDGLGRLISVKSPNENERYPSTIDMGYSPVAVMKADGTGISTPAYAVTTYHLRSPYTTPDDILPQNDDMRVVTFTDGFGRVLQTRRETTIDYGNGQPNARVVVEGTTEYDGLGRPVMTHYPVLLPTTHLMIFQPAQLTEPGTSTSYDVADRPLAVTLPGNYTTQYGYSVNNGYLMTSVTDANGHQKDNFTDGSGKTVRTVMYRDAEATQSIETRYLYDPIGRLSTVINADGDSTIVTYDMLGRRTEVRHPASGKTRWTYDKLGNVLTEENEVLRRMGKKIEYTWDVDRIRRVVCNGDTVTYHYGSPSSDGNAAGRVDFRLDRSGGVQYEYDAMGNVKYERRTLAVPQKGNATFETEWVYDSYGKLLRMTYPGDEVVVYRYNETGGLKSVYGGKANQSTPYITHIGYDKFGVPFHRVLANGRETSQRYDDTTRRLHFITFTYNGSLTGYRYYSYDAVGNVTSVFSTAPVNFRFDYGYDSLDRLVSATQRYGLNPSSVNNSLSMAYDDLWRITSKSQHLSQTNVIYPGTLNTGYSMNYSYDPSWGRHYRMKDVAETHYRTSYTPTAADNILSTHSYSYDANGNLAYESVARERHDGVTTTPRVSERKLLWDGMNRLRGISDNGYVSLFWYDADGNRTVKEHQGGEAVWVNGTAAGANTDSVSYSIYPNPYISISGDRWTKHYYIGSERIASRTGTISNFSALNSMQNLPAGDGIMDSVVYSTLRHAQEDSVASMYAQLGVPYQVRRTTTRGEGAHLYFPITRTGEDVDGDSSAGTSDDNPQRNHPSTLGDGQVYFYLRDHLGSTLSVTDSVGNYAQQVEYTPWGEVFVEQQGNSSNFSTPYLFNGKELDEETGLYYYGARYYDPKMSVWYSTDPMEEKYPWVTTYGYCLNNPINSIDFEGNKVLFVNGYYNSGALSIYAGSNCCENYWSKSFINAGMSYFGESGGTPFFIDGRGKWNSSGSDRFNEGVLYAKNHYSEIISGLEKDEPINVVSHSMGSAYAEGIISFLISRDIKIGEVVHLSSADPSCFNAHSSNTYQLQYENDPILLYKNFGEKNIISGVNRFGIIKYDGPHDYSHGKTKFDPETWNALKDLKSIKLNFIKNEELYYYGQMSFSIRQGVYNSGKSSSTQFKSLFINGSSYSYKNNNTYYGRPE